jgi:hypothetical protein
MLRLQFFHDSYEQCLALCSRGGDGITGDSEWGVQSGNEGGGGGDMGEFFLKKLLILNNIPL